MRQTTHPALIRLRLLSSALQICHGGKFYDAVMGDGPETAERLSELIRLTKPDARNVLEPGCGTGSILRHLQDMHQVSGLDISSWMHTYFPIGDDILGARQMSARTAFRVNESTRL